MVVIKNDRKTEFQRLKEMDIASNEKYVKCVDEIFVAECSFSTNRQRLIREAKEAELQK